MIPVLEVSEFHQLLVEDQAELQALPAEFSYCLQQFDNDLQAPPMNQNRRKSLASWISHRRRHKTEMIYK